MPPAMLTANLVSVHLYDYLNSRKEPMSLKAIQALNKQTFALESILTFSKLTNTTDQAKLALIEITAAETLKELAPEIEAIKNAAMEAAGYRDYVGGYTSGY
jgi:hypothetical protein